MSIKILSLTVMTISVMLLVSCGSPQTIKILEKAESGSDYYNALPENVDKYITLIGIKKPIILGLFDETPEELYDLGLEFKKAKIKLWFNETNNRVIRVLLSSKNIDFNGVKIGDTLEAFEIVFGVAVHIYSGLEYRDYLYEGCILRLNYDAASRKTESVCLMSES